MFNKGFLFKVIFGLIGIAAATGVIYILYIKPFAPTDLFMTTATTTGFTYDNCAPIVHFYDRSVNEDDFRVYRRNLATSAFAMIQILPPQPGQGKEVIAVDAPLPLGTYEYKVSAYNQYGESFSDIKQVTVDYPDCAKLPPISTVALPMNPIIVSISVVNDCNVLISYRDNSTNELGIRIYRAIKPEGKYFWENEAVIANFGPHAGIPGTYIDKTNLPEGLYHYRLNAYNASGQSFSNFSEITVNTVCNSALHALPTQISAPLLMPTVQKLSTNSCTWQSKANVFLRKGPNVGVYDRLVSVEAGQGFPIVGQSEDGQFWAVEVSPGVAGYITKSENYSITNGDCSNVPTLKDPPPPVIEATPTKKPAGDNNGGDNSPVPATSCPVGAVCP
jgi:hypothetical protein